MPGTPLCSTSPHLRQSTLSLIILSSSPLPSLSTFVFSVTPLDAYTLFHKQEPTVTFFPQPESLRHPFPSLPPPL
ncbi:uncharacterized protein EI97DRAFT_198868 [Westerdykella ornata]|uniref:Uncharacterized protein n=1 Tax=Westerdykella ornata TaxID=318751 RepID=A0A6A6J9Q6_WESOR|nr:uncharacterized protein EI97DRAFT_198868 [Westerdykella ornata]KAF2272718.1 hypothetical protein EI97DRAFT_198868 [Westerdykella ornata]